ncbi:MAG: T9SS type A sorting domain-containing protein [Flavobacteriaceae bacterium]|nr:T9SS type A sorting domain-containing protein [Flavobacteriaceae bacterium]
MKKITLIFISIGVFAFGQTTVDFEPGGTGASWTWTVDQNSSNPALEIVANPNATGLNTSASVAKFTATGAGEPWALTYTDNVGSFTFSENNSIVKIKVRKDIPTPVGLKFEDTSVPPPYPSRIVEVANTQVNGDWEELTFNFSIAIGETFNRMIIIPDFYDRSIDTTIYFDDISFNSGGSVVSYNLEDIDFETNGFGADWVWTVHQNNTNPALEFVANPNTSGINSTSTVAKFTSLDFGESYALTFTDYIGSFTFDQNNKIVTLMVNKSVISDVGIKFEVAGTGTHVQLVKPNTVTDGSWEQLTFDFSAQIGNTYNRLVIIPDFADRTQNNVSYFDQLSFGSTAGLDDNIFNAVKMFPNPAKDVVQFSINANEQLAIEIFDVLGKSVLRIDNVQNEVNVSELNSGLYFVHIALGDQKATKKLVVN